MEKDYKLTHKWIRICDVCMVGVFFWRRYIIKFSDEYLGGGNGMKYRNIFSINIYHHNAQGAM